MQDAEKRFMLHYGGEVFPLGDSDHRILGGGEWLTIAVGTGIPIAIRSVPVSAPQLG